MSRVNLLNTQIDNLTMQEALEAIDNLIQTQDRSYVVTPNVDHIVRLEKDPEFKTIYDHASLILTDGQPLIWMSRLNSNPIKEKVSGSDLFPRVCELAAQKGYSLFLLGAAEGVADIAASNLKQKFKGLNIVGTYSPRLGFETDSSVLEHIFLMIERTRPDILVLGLGSPKQEKFFYKYQTRLPIRIALNLGASIDFAAGYIKRAPIWMQNSGLEWFYRLCEEPQRLYRRYLIDDLKIIKLFFRYSPRNRQESVRRLNKKAAI